MVDQVSAPTIYWQSHTFFRMQRSRICLKPAGGVFQKRHYSNKLEDAIQNVRNQLAKANENKNQRPESKLQTRTQSRGGILGKPIGTEFLKKNSPRGQSMNPRDRMSGQKDIFGMKNSNSPEKFDPQLRKRRPKKDNEDFIPMPERVRKGQPGSHQSRRRPTSSHPARTRPVAYKPDIPVWEYGTDLEKEYMNNVFKSIYDINEHGRVKFLNDEGSIEDGNIMHFIDLVPEDNVLGIADVQENYDEKVALIKFYERRPKLKEYTDKMAEEKTKLFGRTKKNKKDSTTKNIKVSWEISQSDLDNQKTNEIVGQLKKGFKIQLVIGERVAINRKNFLNKLGKGGLADESDQSKEEQEFEEQENFDDEPETYADLNLYEEMRRTKVLDQVKALLEGSSTYQVKGNIRSRILINAEPLAAQEEKKVDEKRKLKDQKKLERQMKEKLRQEKKKAKMESKKSQLSPILEDE